MTNFRNIVDGTKFDRILNRDFATCGRSKGYVEVGDDKFCMPLIFKEYFEPVKKFRTRHDDVFVCGFPKSGTRWTMELVWLVMNNFDCDGARREFVDYRCPRLEALGLYSYFPETLKDIKEIEMMAGQRCMATHLPWPLLPDDILNNNNPQPKVVAILRGSADVCLSYYHQMRSVLQYDKTFDEFCEVFLSERLPLGPYWTYVDSYWEQRHRLNVFILKYEDMKTDLPSCIRKLAEFLGKTVPEDDLPKICDHLSFDSMKNMDSFNLKHVVKHYTSGVNPFVRNGVIGGHKAVMSKKYIQKFKEMDEKRFGAKGLNFS